MRIFNSAKISLSLVILVTVIAGGAVGLFYFFNWKNKAAPFPTPFPGPFPGGIELPKEDVIGEDLEEVPRYLPSVRLSYSKDTYGNALFVDIEYYTKDTPSKVREFYFDEMPKYDWKAISEEAEPGISLPFVGVSVGESRTIDFRKQDCTDPEWCLPYAKITLGGFKVGEEEYTLIRINYEERAEGVLPEEGEVSPETETSPLKPVTPASDFGKQLDGFMREVLGNALGEVVLTSYSEGVGMTMEYSLALPIDDASSAAGAIKAELVKKGVPEQIIMVDVSAGQAFVSVTMWEFFGRAGMLNVNIYEGEKKLDVSFAIIPIGG